MISASIKVTGLNSNETWVNKTLWLFRDAYEREVKHRKEVEKRQYAQRKKTHRISKS